MATNDLSHINNVVSSDWIQRTACADIPLDEFWPDPGFEASDRAKAACVRCPVRTECIKHVYYMESKKEGRYGYWAATSPRVRSLMTVDEAVAQFGSDVDLTVNDPPALLRHCNSCDKELPNNGDHWYYDTRGQVAGGRCRSCLAALYQERKAGQSQP